MITMCITACNRNELLFQTIDSFLATNTFPVADWLLREDSGKPEVVKEIQEKYPFITVISGENVGQAASIDLLYSEVKTKYIFHCEEDWLFSGNSEFLKQSFEILEYYNNIHQVWIRKGMEAFVEHNVEFEHASLNNGFNFSLIRENHLKDWNGFSWNPGLRRLSDYKTMFPNGFSEFAKIYKSGAALEKECMENTKKFNYRAAILKDCVCEHIGHKNPTKK